LAYSSTTVLFGENSYLLDITSVDKCSEVELGEVCRSVAMFSEV